jgi:hypothetical protein
MANEQVNATVVPVSSSSRYRKTRIYKDIDLNQVYFGTWRVPDVVERLATTIHVVAPDEFHRLDLISYRVYKRADLFWAIAIRNGILLPMIDLLVGQSLICPHIEDVMSSLGTASTLSEGTI